MSLQRDECLLAIGIPGDEVLQSKRDAYVELWDRLRAFPINSGWTYLGMVLVYVVFEFVKNSLASNIPSVGKVGLPGALDTGLSNGMLINTALPSTIGLENIGHDRLVLILVMKTFLVGLLLVQIYKVAGCVGRTVANTAQG
jgi:hypothetical protein